MIYFVRRTDGLVKIGATYDFGSEFARLTARYGDLEILGRMDGGRGEEESLHQRFVHTCAAVRDDDGWFYLSPHLVAFIDFLECNIRRKTSLPIKRCPMCKRDFPATTTYFGPNKNNKKSGIHSKCRQCAKDYQIQRREKHPSVQRKPEDRMRSRIHSSKRNARKRLLPSFYTQSQWEAALRFFRSCCAVCGRSLVEPTGDYVAAMDHWIPLSSVKCPGTVPDNIVPLCHGRGGCNNSKHKRLPQRWLVERFGRDKADEVLIRIEAYFAWVRFNV